MGFSHKLTDKSTFGLGVTKNLYDNSTPHVEAGLSGTCTDKMSSKIKVDNQGKFSFNSKYVLDKFVTITGSAEVNFKNGCCPFDFHNYYFTPFGYQIDLNY